MAMAMPRVFRFPLPGGKLGYAPIRVTAEEPCCALFSRGKGQQSL